MDHLPLPNAPVLRFIKLPFLITESVQDDGDFSTFPSRHGWQIKGIPGKASVTRHGNDANVIEIGAMLQSWACLGLVSAFMGQQIDQESMKEYCQDGTYFSTRALGSKVSAWSEDFVEQEVYRCRSKLESWKAERYGYIQRARHVVLQLQPTERFRPLATVFMSHAAIGEFLVQVIKDICFTRDIKQPVRLTWRVPDRVDCGQPILDVMAKTGWCADKIARLEASTTIPIGKLWYLAHMSPPSTKDHHQFVAGQCQHLNVEKSTYDIAHTSPNCQCQSYGPRLHQVISVLNHGIIPVLGLPDISKADMDFQVEPEIPDIPYVAISHVWADGHGNPDENTLPACFLASLVCFLRNLPGSPSRFWIDTLCVPLKPHAMRRKAITLLRDTYQRAAIVLVLDSLLMTLDSAHMNPVELGARISCCGWAERLWTFQEGRLGRRVFFQFRDQAVEPYDAIDFVWRMSFRRIPTLPSHSVDLAFISHWTSTTLLETSIMRGVLTKLPAVRHALCARSTTNESDEAICLASIMGLDAGRVYDSSEAFRMEAFWSQLQEVPVGLAFSTAAKKLSRPGFRWAPASLMGDLGNPLWIGPDECIGDFTARPTSTGLVVKLPSFHISLAAGVGLHSKVRPKQLMDFRTGDAWPLMDTNGVYYNCIIAGAWHPDRYDPGESDQFTIAVARHPVSLQAEGVPSSLYNPDWVEDGILICSSHPVDELNTIPAKAVWQVRLAKVGTAYQTLFATNRKFAESFMESKEWKHSDLGLMDCLAEVISFMKNEQYTGPMLEGFGQYEEFEPSEESFYSGIASCVWQWPFWGISTPRDVTWCLD